MSSSPTITTLGVVGAGLMGSGIAQVAASQGIEVVLYDVQEDAAANAIGGIRERLDKRVAQGKLAREGADAAVGRLRTADSLEDFAECGAVIEAVVENVDIKADLFAELMGIVREDAVLATNTSSLPITAIAAKGSRPEQIIGMHFFSPVPAMKLVEVIRGAKTSDTTVQRALDLLGQLGKEHILVSRDDAGFVTSRLMSVFIGEATRIVEAGLSTPEEVDRACRLAFGHAMGPFATADLTGIDVSVRATDAIYRQTGELRFKPAQTLQRLMTAGDLGRKTGRGFYDYTNRE